MSKAKKTRLGIILCAILVICLTVGAIFAVSMTAFATGTSYAITNGTPESNIETNHGYITIDKSSASEGETVTITVKPNEGYQLKSLTATPVAPTISTIADVLATVEGFPKDIIENSSPTVPSDAWTNGTGSAFTYKNLALVLKSSSYMYAQLTTGVTFDATNKCYTATISYGSLTFNMENGILTSFEFTGDPSKPNAAVYVGTYTPASTPSPRLKPITPAKQTDGTYQFTMPAANVTVTAEFEKIPPHIHGEGTEAEINFTPWTDATKLPDKAGNYALDTNVTLSSTWSVPEGTTNLCLNGYVINANGGNFSVIKVGAGATLNLYDCGTTVHNGYVDSTGLWHLDMADEHNGQNDEKDITGGIITGGNAATNGGGVNVSGTVNMYGGNIAGNTAQNGGGVSNIKSFTMTGGNIVGNTATTNGGGVYASSVIFVNILTGGTITGNTAQNGGGVYYQVEQCFAPGTLITMADGTRQKIETLNIGDSVRVFDHEKGEISSSKIFDVWTYPEKHSGVVKLHFSHNIDVTVVYGHSFFEREQNKYVAVTRDNVSTFVGHEFYNVDNERWETLEGYEFIDGEVDTYVLTTEYQLNCVANGMLSNEDGFYTLLTNIFEYSDNLKIDQVKKAQDIENFGLYGYENIKHMSKYVYDVLNFQYLKVAFGKNLITENEFNYLEAYYAEVDPELYCAEKEEIRVERKSVLVKAPLKAPLLTSSVSAPTSGFYVGGSIKIVDNSSGNVYLSGGKHITIGTGIVGDGNGVVAPTEDMSIGITLADGTGQFTANGIEDYLANFFSDNENYKVSFNAGTDADGDEYLELKATTIADILSDGFPTSEDGNAPSNAWVNSSNEKMFSWGDGLYVTSESDGDFVLLANTTLTKDGNNYKCTKDGATVTFIMDDGALTSISIEGLTDCAKLNGTYSAPHVHSFKYFASDNVITATCDNTDDKCGLTDCKLTLTLSAPVSLGYDGNAKAFTFADGEAAAWTGEGLELPTFEYYLDKPETPWLDGLDGDPIAAAEGYVVMIRVGVKAAQVEFSITQAEVEKPQEDTTVFTYNCNPQTYTVASSERYEVSGNTQTVAGTHEVKISLTDTVNYKWKDGDSDNLTYSFVIAKAQVAIPAEDTASFVYTAGSDLTYTIAENELYTVSGNVQKNAGSYEITVALKDTDNYEWEDSTTDDRTYSFVIAKAQVAIPEEDTTNFVYTGNDLTYTIAENELYTVEGNVKKNAGEYEVTVSLKDTDNYEWEDSTTDDLTYNFVITKAQAPIPAEDTTNFVYTGSDLTYAIAANEHYTVAGNVQKDAGSYEITVALKDKDNYKWKDGDSDNLTYSFVIAKAQVVIPAEDTTNFVYTGSDLTYTIAENEHYTVDGNVKKDAGEYEVTVSLKDTDNYEWEDSTTDDLTYSFVIAKAQVAIPAEDTASFVYTGSDLTYTIAANELYTVDGNVKKNAGEYEVTVSLKDTDNYEWADNTTADLTYNFVIAKAQNAIHDLSIINYKASEQGTAPTATADFGTVEYRYAKAGSSSETETMPTQAGKYTVRAFVSGTDNYDGAEATKSFTIWYADLKPAQNGNKVQIIASENGLDPEAVLVVEVVALEKAEDSEAFVNTIEDHGIDMKDKKVYGVYEAKLLINNVETQPNGKVSVRIAVPEEVKDKEFKLYHIHTDAATGKVTVSEIKCSAMAADGTVTFETDKFSQFAFVADTDCAMHWIMIAILVLFIAAFAVFGFVMKKKLYLLIACGVCGAAAIVLAFFGACTICTIFTVIDLAVIAIGTAFTCFFGKKLLGIA